MATELLLPDKDVTALRGNLRNLVHRHDDCGEELVGNGLHVLDGGLQPVPHLLVAHGLLWSHVVRQLTVAGTRTIQDRGWDDSCATNGH